MSQPNSVVVMGPPRISVIKDITHMKPFSKRDDRSGDLIIWYGVIFKFENKEEIQKYTTVMSEVHQYAPGQTVLYQARYETRGNNTKVRFAYLQAVLPVEAQMHNNKVSFYEKALLKSADLAMVDGSFNSSIASNVKAWIMTNYKPEIIDLDEKVRPAAQQLDQDKALQDYADEHGEDIAKAMEERGQEPKVVQEFLEGELTNSEKTKAEEEFSQDESGPAEVLDVEIKSPTLDAELKSEEQKEKPINKASLQQQYEQVMSGSSVEEVAVSKDGLEEPEIESAPSILDLEKEIDSIGKSEDAQEEVAEVDPGPGEEDTLEKSDSSISASQSLIKNLSNLAPEEVSSIFEGLSDVDKGEVITHIKNSMTPEEIDAFNTVFNIDVDEEVEGFVAEASSTVSGFADQVAENVESQKVLKDKSAKKKKETKKVTDQEIDLEDDFFGE